MDAPQAIYEDVNRFDDFKIKQNVSDGIKFVLILALFFPFVFIVFFLSAIGQQELADSIRLTVGSWL